MKQLYSTLLFIFFSLAGICSHVVSGTLGYEYLGKFGNNYRYKVILISYINCDATSQVPNFEGPSLMVGVYGHDVQNNPTGGGPNKGLITNCEVFLSDSTEITPDLPNGCAVGENVCIKKGIYEGTFEVPVNFNGLHLFYERCCRNNSIVNLQFNQSMAFYCFVPPTLVANDSPKFTNEPIPFMCVGDTFSLLNSAYDADGDLLVFSLVTPYNGFADENNPAPSLPFSIGWPIPNVQYNGGYNSSLPFGAGGYSSIQGSTGLSTFVAPNSGIYVVAIEIREYRNGKLIGISRRDLQLLVINCPSNPAPYLDNTQGSTSTNFTLEEGENLCFDFGFGDTNNDSITLTVNGAIFDSSQINPAATINQPVTGLDTVSTTFCWQTACGQARTAPYQFQASATDNGCPPKSTNLVYSITVNPVAPPASISGDQLICQHNSEIYSTPAVANSTFTWTVTGGNVINTNANSIEVQWPNVGSGTVQVSRINQFGCSSSFIEKQVTIVAAPLIEAGTDTVLCSGDSIQMNASITSNSGYTFGWTIDNSITDTSVIQAWVTPTGTHWLYLNAALGNCASVDSVLVAIQQINADAGNNATICSNDSIALNASTNGSSFAWTSSPYLNDTSVLTPISTPDSTTTFYFLAYSPIGCIANDSVTITVDQMFNMVVSEDTTICMGNCLNINATGASSYAWLSSATLSDTTISSPIACPLASETYYVYGYNGTCIDSSEVLVELYALPNVEAGDSIDLCLGDTALLVATGANTYNWIFGEEISNVSIANPQAWPSFSNLYIVEGVDNNNCINKDSVWITVHTLPFIDAGNDTSLCIGDSIQLNATGGYNYVWDNASGLSNINSSSPFVSPVVTTTYHVTGTDSNGCALRDSVLVSVNNLPVLSISPDTAICFGDTLMLWATGGTEFNWKPNNLVSNSLEDTTLAYPTATTTFNVIISDMNRCTDSIQTTVTVYALPNINAGLDTSICLGDTIALNGSGGIIYSWEPNIFINDSSVSNPIIWPSDTLNYLLTGTDAAGCSSQDTITINVKPIPLANAGGDLWICPGDNVQINASGGINYTWNTQVGLSDSTISNPIASPSDTANYFLTVESDQGCLGYDSITIYVNQTVPTSAGEDTVICFGDSISIGGTPTAPQGTTFLWSGSNIVNNNVSNPIVFPSTSQWYYVYTSNDTCTGVDSIYITVNPLPNISVGPDLSICIQDTTILNATGGISYTWIITDSLSDPFISSPLAWPTTTTNYSVFGTDNNGCTNSDSLWVIVNNLPTVNSGTDTALCLNDSIWVTATGGISFNWQPNNQILSADSASALVFPLVSQFYSVNVTDSNGCSNSDSLFVTVHQLPNISAGNDLAHCIYDSSQLLATGGLTYSWSPQLNLTTPFSPDPWTSTTTDETYILTGIDSNGCTNRDTVSVIVFDLPLISAGSNSQICQGDSIQLTATGGLSYLWQPDGLLENPTNAITWSFPLDTTDFWVIGTDANNCSNIDTVKIIVNPLPVLSLSLSDSICMGDTTQIAVSGAQSYTWTPDEYLDQPGSGLSNVFPNQSVFFSVTAIDSNQCIRKDSVYIHVFDLPNVYAGIDQNMCLNDSIQLSGSGAIVYNWSPVNFLDDGSISNPWCSATSDQNYTLIGIDENGCSNQDQIAIFVNSLPNVSAGSDVQICLGDSTQLSASGAINYSWSPNQNISDNQINTPLVWPGDTIMYTVTGTDANNCSNIANVYVIVNPLPEIITSGDVNICLGDTTQLMASGGVAYEWLPTQYLSNPTLALPLAYPAMNTTYHVTVTDSNNCLKSDSLTVWVFRIFAHSDTAICFNDSVQLNVTGSPGEQYSWSPNQNISDNSLPQPIVFPGNTTTYVVTASDINGCTDVDSVNIVVNQLPELDFTYQAIPTCEGMEIITENLSSNATQYLWTLEPNESNELAPEFLITYGTNNLLKLEAWSVSGCYDFVEKTVVSADFDNYYSIEIPNVFTPNEDGQNDAFTVAIPGKIGHCANIHIFNRWGQTLFKSFGKVYSWDGNDINGNPVSDGTYFYTISLLDKSYSGTVTVYR